MKDFEIKVLHEEPISELSLLDIKGGGCSDHQCGEFSCSNYDCTRFSCTVHTELCGDHCPKHGSSCNPNTVIGCPKDGGVCTNKL